MQLSKRDVIPLVAAEIRKGEIVVPTGMDLCMEVYGFPAPAARWEALWSRPERHVGMPNLENTCFVSAVVQVLLRVAPLRAMVDKHAETCRLTARRCAVCALSQQARVLLEARGAGWGREDRAPIAVAARRGLLGNEFKPINRLDPRGRPEVHNPQCDARDLLEALFKALALVEFPRIPDAAQALLRESVIDEHLIGRVYRQRVICRTCSRASDCFEWERFLRLYPAQHPRRSGVIPLQELIAWQINEVDTNVKRCETCGDAGDEGRAHETHVFPERDPAVLVVVLVRTLEDQLGSRDQTRVVISREIDGLVPREMDGLALRPRRYRFAGAVCHISYDDTSNGGHYVAACDVGENRYRMFNDDRVGPPVSWALLSGDADFQKNAYILVYVSQSEPAPPEGSAPDAGGDGGDGPAASRGDGGRSKAGSSDGGAGGKRRKTEGAAATQAAGASAPAQKPAVGAGRKRKADDKPTGAGAASSSAAAQPQPQPPASPGQLSEWRSFTPRDIDPLKCMARTWGQGAGAQCTNGAVDDGLCRRHYSQRAKGSGWHGRVDGPIPDEKLKEFHAARAKQLKAGNHKPSRAGQAAEPAQSDSEIRPVPAPQAAERRAAGSDGSGGRRQPG